MRFSYSCFRVCVVTIAGSMLVAFNSDPDQCQSCPAFRKGFTYTKVEFSSDSTSQGSTTITVDSVYTRNDTLFSVCSITGTSSSLKPVNSGCIQWCANGSYSVDLMATAAMAPESTGKVKTFEFTELYYPLRISQGDTLPNGHFQVSIKESWGISTVRSEWRNRKCLGPDTVLIAGKVFETQKIQSSIKVVVKQGPVTMLSVSNTFFEWFSPAYGILKTESYEGTKLLRYTRVISIKEGS